MYQDFLSEDEASGLYSAGDAAHDFDHVLRVTRLAERIAAAEGADRVIVRLASLLHDVPVNVDADGVLVRGAHHMAAAAFARDFLTRRGLGNAQVANVVHCIEAHRFRDRSILPDTLEAKCLYDADKLDSIGAIGVGRAFAFAGAHDSRLWTEPWGAAPSFDAQPIGGDYTPVHEFVYKLQRILPTLYTATAQMIGGRRYQFMLAFYDQLDAEMLGLA